MFLLDTSALSALLNQDDSLHAKAIAFKDQLAGQEQRLFICVISLAEMQFGLNMYERRSPKPNQTATDAVRGRIQAAGALSEPLEVTRHVAIEQGQLRSRWAWKVAPRKAAQGKLKGVPPERWSDDWPANTLQITENDIWIAAMALTHDLTLVTCDKDFDKLAQADLNLRIMRL
ncbi:PIN domain-containing protein [Hydrogenophaga sp.]|uniref:PIN domain-containing protein n=1 Tax=Hydrogenophaga sp. TaxID=1904254 RepID=UPI003F6E7F30